MCRLPILMTVAFIGFILVVANLPEADCSGKGKEKMEGSNTNEMENAPADEGDDDDIALRQIFVGQLPYSTSDETLREYFKQFGEVENAYIIRNRRTHESKGYGFVTMKNKEGADRALGKAEPKIDGRFVKINLTAKPKHNKDLSDHLNSRNQLRQSESEDISSREIFVGGLWYETTHKALRRYFQQYGEVEKAFVKIDENTGKNQGYGYVLMKDKEGADRALENPNPMIDGRFVDVNLASKPENNKHLSARLNSMNRLPQSQKPKPNIDGQRANVNFTSLRANAQSYTPLASRSTSMNPTPQLQWRRKENPNPNTAGQTSNVPSAYLVANPHSNANLASSSNSRYQHSAPQNSHYMIFENENGKFIQPGILHPPATQNSHYMIFDTPNGTLAHPLPNLAARQFQRSLTRHLSMLNSRPGGQQPTTNVRIGEPSQPESRRPAYEEATGSTGQKLPTESETNKKIGKPSQRPKSAPAVLQATGTTNNNFPSHNNENWFERYSVKRNKSERNNQQNIVFDYDKNKKDSTVEGKKLIEEESEITEKHAVKKDDPKHTLHDEPNSALKADLSASEKNDGATSVPESSSKVEDRKMNWADMVEEKENQQTKKEEKEQQTNNAVLHHPIMVAKKHEAAEGNVVDEAEKSNVDATVEHHKNPKLETMVFDDNKKDQEQKHTNEIEEKIPNINDEKDIGGHLPHQKLQTMVFDDHKKDVEQKHSNMIEEKFLILKEEMPVDDHSPKEQGDKLSKDIGNNPVKNDEAPAEASKKSYLDAIKKPTQMISKKKAHSLLSNNSKVDNETTIKKNNLTNKIEGEEQENDEKREIFVGQLAYSATDETLQEYFQQFGDVEKTMVVIDPKTQKSRGFGFVWMKEEKDVKKALQNPNPTINGRPVYLEAYEGAKRKNKRFSTLSNSPKQLPQLQEGQKKKTNSNMDGRKAGLNPPSNMHLVAPTEKIEKHFSGNFPIEQDDKLISNDDVNNPIKNDVIPAEPRKKSYLNVAKTQQSASKKDDVTHSLPASTIKVGDEDANKKKNLVEKVEEDEKNEQVAQTYASIAKPKNMHQPPKEAQTYEKAEGKATAEGEVENSNASADEPNKIQQSTRHAQNHDMEEISEEKAADRGEDIDEGNEKSGENSSLHVPIHPASSKAQGESGGKTKKGSKKKKGVAKNVDAKGNGTESWKLTDFGDSPQILEGEDQKKSTINKSVDVGTSSDFMATLAKQRVKKLANYLGLSLSHFRYWYFLHFEIALPTTNDHFELLLDNALLDHLDVDPKKTILEIVKLIKGGLQGRRLKYIRLIGAGSLRQQSAQYIFDKELRDEHVAALAQLEKENDVHYNFDKLDRQQRQIFAIYQLALTKRIADLFKITPANVTVEDLHFDESEKKFLEENFGYTTILSENGILSHGAEMDNNDVTLIIILNCSTKMTTNLIKSYGNQSKQLILMESTMSDLYEKKHTKNKDKKHFQENRRQFQIRKPLPTTFYTEYVFQQKDVKDVQICYAKVSAKSAQESSKLPNKSNIDDLITTKGSKITNANEKLKEKIEEIRVVSTISEMIANIASPTNDVSDDKIVAKQEKNKRKKEKRTEAKARKVELMTSKKDGTANSVAESSNALKAEASELSPKIESPNKVKDISIIEKRNQETKEKMDKVLTEALLDSKSINPATSMKESSYKALKKGLMASKKESAKASLKESSSAAEQPKDESLNIGAKGIEKMFAKNENKNE